MKTQSINLNNCIYEVLTLSPGMNTTPCWVTIPETAQYFIAVESELAREFSAPLPAGVIVPQPPEIGPDEFEDRYQWFLA